MTQVKELIIDNRLTPTMERVRSGKVQLFREKNPEDRSFIDEDNCDIKLQHENKAMYAELIENKWYWVNGCGPCDGEERSWKTYIECDKHDVCNDCGISRKNIKDNVWGFSNGWKCEDCKNIIDIKLRREAFDRLNGELPDCTYCDEIICPHCGSELGTDEHESGEIECYICDGLIELRIDYTVTYSTSVKGERLIK